MSTRDVDEFELDKEFWDRYYESYTVRESRTTCPNCKEVLVEGEDTLKVENVESDVLGRDLITYTCPRCSKKVTSLVYT
jgi:uncharacterized protein with PIN domain